MITFTLRLEGPRWLRQLRQVATACAASSLQTLEAWTESSKGNPAAIIIFLATQVHVHNLNIQLVQSMFCYEITTVSTNETHNMPVYIFSIRRLTAEPVIEGPGYEAITLPLLIPPLLLWTAEVVNARRPDESCPPAAPPITVFELAWTEGNWTSFWDWELPRADNGEFE